MVRYYSKIPLGVPSTAGETGYNSKSQRIQPGI